MLGILLVRSPCTLARVSSQANQIILVLGVIESSSPSLDIARVGRTSACHCAKSDLQNHDRLGVPKPHLLGQG